MALVGALMAAPAGAKDKPDDKKSKQVELQILALNDFHGNINTFSSSFGATGGAQNLATNIAAAEAGVRNSIFVSAGDLIGASPLISALFHDEPTIEVMNAIGLDINGVGNHEFDEGAAELLRMQKGGSHPVDGDLDGDGFEGADFKFLAANVIVNDSGKTLFPAYTIKNYQGVKVAFIGLTLEGTPSIVTPAGVAGLTFRDEAETVNSIVRQLRRKTNIESFVILLHEGGMSDGGQNDCGTTLTGPIASIVPQFHDAVDLVIAGHTNDEFICELDGKVVTMADNAGRLFTDIDVTLDRKSKDMTVVSVNNVPNLQSAADDPDVQALIDKYNTLSAPLANTVIGSVDTDITRVDDAEGESPLGQVIADAQLAATAPAGSGEAVVAFMNKGGVRDEIDFVASGAEGDGNVTFGEAFAVQPFGNSLVTMTLTGEQIDILLEQQFQGAVSKLDVSNGFTYSLSASAPAGSKVSAIMINNVAVDPAGSYRVTVNSFLADGGDNYPVLIQGTNRLGGDVDLDALVAYFAANSPVAPGPQNRVTPLP
jgi:5'-nucleotidase